MNERCVRVWWISAMTLEASRWEACSRFFLRTSGVTESVAQPLLGNPAHTPTFPTFSCPSSLVTWRFNSQHFVLIFPENTELLLTTSSNNKRESRRKGLMEVTSSWAFFSTLRVSFQRIQWRARLRLQTRYDTRMKALRCSVQHPRWQGATVKKMFNFHLLSAVTRPLKKSPS